jgi:GNAT superfamily N-acetyltransferase
VTSEAVSPARPTFRVVTRSKLRDDVAILRILDSLDATSRALSEETVPVRCGLVARTSSLPLIWSLNQLRITEPADFDELCALAGEYLGDLPYRHLVVEHETTALAVEDQFRQAGWRIEREVVMELTAPGDKEADVRKVVELTEDEMVGLMERWIAEERPAITPEGIRQVGEYSRREGRLWNETSLGIREAGVPVAITKYRSDGQVAWVEDVYTVPEARRRGYARMLVTRAVELARAVPHELTFIIADDEDWPKNLYASIGFRPVGTMRIFHLEVAEPA